ncbi:MAG: 6-bladed beta-propeller [Candidatus Aminicenantes bacterium]|nr:6-bladed beta-propeller [Candidatus Aminicenantes bacterium]
MLFIISCSKEPETTATVEVIDGVEHIHNIATPLYPSKTVTFEEELSIGGEDEERNILIYQPRSFLVDEDEMIYIVDGQDQVIKVFDSTGSLLRSFGAKGEGPGEFQSIGYFSFLPDGRLLVMDSRARRTSLFDQHGDFISSHQWTKSLSQAHLTTNSSYIIQEYTFEDGDNPLSERILLINEYDFEGNEVRSYGEFTPPKFNTHSEKNITVGVRVPHARQSVFAGDLKRQQLYHCLSSTYLIEVFDMTGKIVRKIDRPYEPLPFTSGDKDEFLARYENSRNERMKKIVQSIVFPSVKSVVQRMIVDDEGRLWVVTSEQKEEDEVTFTSYDIFNSDGHYEAKVWIDKPPSYFLKGKMYRMHTDEDSGYRYLKRYRVIWSE